MYVDKIKRAAYMRAWYAKNRSVVLQRKRRDNPKRNLWKIKRRREIKALIDVMKSQPCSDCWGVFDPVCMDFDHRPGTIKVESVARLVGKFSLEVVLAEIAKCDLVCANCHRLRTKTRASKG